MPPGAHSCVQVLNPYGSLTAARSTADTAVWWAQSLPEASVDLLQLGIHQRISRDLCLGCAYVQKGGGLVQCAFGMCWRAFHVLCARSAGNVLAFRQSDGAPLGFCALHSKDRFARTRQGLIAESAPVDQVGAENVEEEEAGAAEPNEYELQRLRNIERNRQRLAELQRKHP